MNGRALRSLRAAEKRSRETWASLENAITQIIHDEPHPDDLELNELAKQAMQLVDKVSIFADKAVRRE